MQCIEDITSFGDARRFLLQTAISIRDGGIDINQAMAIAACMKVVNDNIQAEINAAKTQLLFEDRGKRFVNVLDMGRNIISSGTSTAIEHKE